ncbi:MAG: ribosome maturation factor RimM [Cytophagaceae bacterium]
MTIDSCFKLGQIQKAHGFKGEVMAQLQVKHPEDYKNLESVFVEINQKLVPFFIDSLKLTTGDKAIIKFEDLNNEAAVKSLIGHAIYLPLEEMTEEEESNLSILIGYQVDDKNLGRLGKISEVYTMPGQEVLGMDWKEKEVLIPAGETILLKADHKKKILHVDLPEGLLDLYLDNQGEEE